jgi:DNA-binding NarL/FixJ family response regulator
MASCNVTLNSGFMKIYLVEDSELIRARLRHIVDEVPGATVVGESDNEEHAVARIALTRPDVVVLDLRLARGSGFELLRRIRPLWRDLRIIVLTFNSAPPYRRQCKALGADLFLDKARDIEHLAAHLAARQPIAPTYELNSRKQ